MNRTTRPVRRPLVVVVTLLALSGLSFATAGTAGADPDPNNPGTAAPGVTDFTRDYVGQGADAFAELTDNVAAQVDAQTGDHPVLSSYDAVNPQTGLPGDTITPKPGCSSTRLNGANAGITALKTETTPTTHSVNGVDQTYYCLDFVRASRAKKTDGTENSLTFYAQSRDAVGYATVGNAYAPTTPLTKSQLKNIFNCVTTDWSEVGGQKGAIHVYTPPTSSATYTFFLGAIGFASGTFPPSGCATASQQNDGRTLAGDPQGIAPYAITKWAAQQNAAPGIADYRGGVTLGLIRGDSTTPPSGGWPSPTRTTSLNGHQYQVLNPDFTTLNPSFGRIFWNAVRNTAPTELQSLFGPDGYLCQHQNDLLVPFGNQPLGTQQDNPNEYCGQQG